MPYRDDFSANQEEVHRLRRELSETREELEELRRKYAKARAVLCVVAESKKIEKLLDEQRKSDVPPKARTSDAPKARKSDAPARKTPPSEDG